MSAWNSWFLSSNISISMYNWRVAAYPERPNCPWSKKYIIGLESRAVFPPGRGTYELDSLRSVGLNSRQIVTVAAVCYQLKEPWSTQCSILRRKATWRHIQWSINISYCLYVLPLCIKTFSKIYHWNIYMYNDFYYLNQYIYIYKWTASVV
jgi:hypothetical protein